MPLTDAQKAAVNTWFGKHQHTACACKYSQWQINDDVYAYPAIRDGAISPNVGLKVIVITCANCGFTRHYSATAMGL